MQPPAQTVALATRLMAPLGIARVTDITRLDHLGLPVCVSVRPRGATLRVHAGKGLQVLDARAGALMEAVEFAAADPARSRWQCERLSVARFLAQFGGRHRLVDFAPRLGVAVHARQRLDAVACETLGGGARVLMPAELVFLPYEAAGPAPVFGWTSNGLASGNSLDEATLHALLEVLERDAMAMNRAHDASRLVLQATWPEPWRTRAAQWAQRGVHLAVRQLPNVLGLPAFEALLHEPDSTDVNLAHGAGLHLQPQVALARAVCEAAQSRLVGIHGGREDVTGFFAKYAAPAPARRRRAEATLARRWFSARRSIDFACVPGWTLPRGGLPAVLAELLAQLAAAGFPAVYRHRFAIDLGGLHVVKLIVPGCELADHETPRFGPRLFARLTQRG